MERVWLLVVVADHYLGRFRGGEEEEGKTNIYPDGFG